MLVYSPLDLVKNELRQAVVQNLPSGSPPSSPVKGQLWFDSTNNVLMWYSGVSWVSAMGGTPPDASTSTKGIVQLAGDLAGTAASPQIATGVIVDTDVAAANKDGLTTVPSLRTLGFTGNSAMPGTARLEQITPPTAGGTITMNLCEVLQVKDPTTGTSAATKNYVDNVAAGIDAKASVRVAYGTNQSLTGAAVAEGGVTPANGERVLCYGQTTTANNGVYTVNTGGAWARSSDMDVWTELVSAFVWVEQGSNQDTGWVCTVDQGGTMGTTAVTWVQFSGAALITAGAGLTKTGNSLDVGAGTGVTVAADTVALDTVYADGRYGRFYSTATHGAGTTITITQATHGLRATRGIHVRLSLESSGEQILADNTVAANGDVTVTFAVSQTANTIRVTLIA